jgi:glycosyltransferase involved in cell wall biosynthesis
MGKRGAGVDRFAVRFSALSASSEAVDDARSGVPRRCANDAPTSSRPVGMLSVVLPVYDEEETIEEVLRNVLNVSLPPGVQLQLIVVESNSKDSTRQIVLAHELDPRVTVVLQDAPRGKGNAVRSGLLHVQGDVVLIQDGDLEYSVDDYAVLLERIISGDADFVLGCRHQRGQPMREFDGATGTSAVLNAAHWTFATLFNLVYGTNLRDPFTMYKVFRTECIDGLDFVADRFDFDWELVAKLVRRGYRPIEVPITYRSRGFDEGKKVRLIRDPLTWLIALVRFRFAHIPPRVVEEPGVNAQRTTV